jgi:hypothetical protein
VLERVVLVLEDRDRKAGWRIYLRSSEAADSQKRFKEGGRASGIITTRRRIRQERKHPDQQHRAKFGRLGADDQRCDHRGEPGGQDGWKPLAYLSFDKEKTVTFRGTIQTVINIGDAFIVNVNEGASDNSRIIGPVRLLCNRTEIPGAIILPEFPFGLDVRVVIQDKAAVLPKSFTFSRQ